MRETLLFLNFVAKSFENLKPERLFRFISSVRGHFVTVIYRIDIELSAKGLIFTRWQKKWSQALISAWKRIKLYTRTKIDKISFSLPCFRLRCVKKQSNTLIICSSNKNARSVVSARIMGFLSVKREHGTSETFISVTFHFWLRLCPFATENRTNF